MRTNDMKDTRSYHSTKLSAKSRFNTLQATLEKVSNLKAVFRNFLNTLEAQKLKQKSLFPQPKIEALRNLAHPKRPNKKPTTNHRDMEKLPISEHF